MTVRPSFDFIGISAISLLYVLSSSRLLRNFPMPAEATANVVNVAHCLDMAADGFVADAQRHAQLFGADFVIFLDKGDDFGVQIVLEDTLRDIIIQVRHDDRELIVVRAECGALALGIVGLHLVAVQDFAEAAALALHVAQPIEHVGQHWVASGGRHVSGSRSWMMEPSGIPPGE